MLMRSLIVRRFQARAIRTPNGLAADRRVALEVTIPWRKRKTGDCPVFLSIVSHRAQRLRKVVASPLNRRIIPE
jgi:hypothetical protein